jgi:hypothetical protein
MNFRPSATDSLDCVIKTIAIAAIGLIAAFGALCPQPSAGAVRTGRPPKAPLSPWHRNFRRPHDRAADFHQRQSASGSR